MEKRLWNNFLGRNYEAIDNGKVKVVTDLQHGSMCRTWWEIRWGGGVRKAIGEEEGFSENGSNLWENKEMANPETIEKKVIVMIIIKQRE